MNRFSLSALRRRRVTAVGLAAVVLCAVLVRLPVPVSAAHAAAPAHTGAAHGLHAAPSALSDGGVHAPAPRSAVPAYDCCNGEVSDCGAHCLPLVFSDPSLVPVVRMHTVPHGSAAWGLVSASIPPLLRPPRL